MESTHNGALICFAIAIHNIPEGIAIAVPYFDADGDRKKAVFMALLYGFYHIIYIYIYITVQILYILNVQMSK